LEAIGIDLGAVRAKLEQAFGDGEGEPAPDDPDQGVSERSARRGFRRKARGGHIPFTPRAKKVLELSLREALHLKHRHISGEHILLGLLREGRGLGATILAGAGIDGDDLRRRTLAAMQRAA
jgi:hypothetical protein